MWRPWKIWVEEKVDGGNLLPRSPQRNLDEKVPECWFNQLTFFSEMNPGLNRRSQRRVAEPKKRYVLTLPAESDPEERRQLED